MNIGEKIKKLRNEKSMTQSELAGGFITRNMLSLIESGSAQPSLSTIKFLAEKLNVPAGILIEDDKYDYFYRRVAAMENIRKAFCAENYRICLDLCEKLDGFSGDNELDLIRGECYLGIAKENFVEGRLKNSCACFDMACEFAKKTAYNTFYITAESYVYCNYMRNISQSLFADCLCDSDHLGMAESDDFCRYALSLDSITSNTSAEDLDLENKIFEAHIKARVAMLNADHKTALKLMADALNGDQRVPNPIMYDFFKDLEICCRETGDFKGAYEYSKNKVVMLERLLSEELY